MNLFLRWRLWRARRLARPSPAFRRELWDRLRGRLVLTHAPKPRWYRIHWFRAAVASVSSLAVCAGFATGAYAYASPDVAAGTPLFPIKQQLESVEESLQRTPAQKAVFYLKQIKRRETETAVLHRKRKSTAAAEAEVRVAEKRLENVSVLLENDHDSDPKIRERVQKQLERHRQKSGRREGEAGESDPK